MVQQSSGVSGTFVRPLSYDKLCLKIARVHSFARVAAAWIFRVARRPALFPLEPADRRHEPERGRAVQQYLDNASGPPRCACPGHRRYSGQVDCQSGSARGAGADLQRRDHADRRPVRCRPLHDAAGPPPARHPGLTRPLTFALWPRLQQKSDRHSVAAVQVPPADLPSGRAYRPWRRHPPASCPPRLRSPSSIPSSCRP